MPSSAMIGLLLVAIGVGILLMTKGKAKQVRLVAGLLVGIGVFAGALTFVGVNFDPLGLAGSAFAIGGLPTTQIDGTAVVLTKGACPDTGRTAVIVDQLNILNTTTTDRFDSTVVFTSKQSGNVVVLTDTSAPAAVNFICGEEYTGRSVSDSDSGSRVRKLLSPVPPGAVLGSDGAVTIKPTGSDYSLTIGTAEISGIEVRAYDKDAAAFVFDTITPMNSATDYEAAGTVFQSSTNNTAIAVGSAGQINYKFDVRAIQTSTDVNDQALWFFVDASSAVWDKPAVSISGLGTLASACDQRDSDERAAAQGSNAEYCYLIPAGTPVENVNKLDLSLSIAALSGTDPGATDDINMTFVSRGGYRSNFNPNEVKASAYQDNSAKTVVIAEAKYMIDVS